MATVVDALVVTLGLDPKQFTKGQKEAAASFLKTRQAAQKEGAAIEKAMDKAGDSVERFARNALKLYAFFTGGKAIKTFIADITDADAALGRLAKSLDTTPQALSALAGAVSRTGGSADAAAASFKKISDAYNEMKLTGQSATYDMLARLSAASGKMIRFGRDTQQTIFDTADAAKAMADRSGTSLTTHILEQAGLDPGTIALLIQGSAKMKEAQDKVRRLGGVVSKQDTDNAQRYQTALRDIGTISEGLGRTIWTNLSPAISEVIEKVIKWYEANGEWLRTEIGERVKQFADYLRSLPWDAVGQGMRDFIKTADDAAKAVGGWKVVFEALLGAWLFTKLAALLRMLGLIRFALTGKAMPGLGSAVLGALGIGGTAAVGAAVGTAIDADVAVPNKDKPALTNNWDDEASGAAGGAGMWGAIKRMGRGVKRMFGGGGAKASGGSIPAIPDSIPMTAQERNTLGLIMEYESHGQNTMNYMGKSQGLDPNAPKGYTAQGYYQMLNSNWRRIAPSLGIKTSNAMSSTLEEQTRVALHLLRHGGIQNWSNYNPSLRQAIARGEQVPTTTVPNVAPSPAIATPRRPEVLTDPNDERRKPVRQPSAWNGYPNAAGIPAMAASTQQIMASHTANSYSRSEDRRSYSDTKIDTVNIHTPATDGRGIMAELKEASKGNKAFAAAADYGKA